MDLNKISLPAYVITNLFEQSLVVPKQKEIANVDHNDEMSAKYKGGYDKWNSTGGNERNILIIVNYPENDHLPANEFDFLKEILKACKILLTDVVIINIATSAETNYKEVTSFFKSKIVLLFDHSPQAFGLPLNFPHYQIQPFSGNSFLSAPALSILSNDKSEKTKLWSALKRLFNL